MTILYCQIARNGNVITHTVATGEEHNQGTFSRIAECVVREPESSNSVSLKTYADPNYSIYYIDNQRYRFLVIGNKITPKNEYFIFLTEWISKTRKEMSQKSRMSTLNS